jgi:hypothetical protein
MAEFVSEQPNVKHHYLRTIDYSTHIGIGSNGEQMKRIFNGLKVKFIKLLLEVSR